MSLLRQVSDIMEDLGEKPPLNEIDAKAKMQWLIEQPKDSAIWKKFPELAIRHQNVIKSMMD